MVSFRRGSTVPFFLLIGTCLYMPSFGYSHYTTLGERLVNDKGPTHFHPHRSPSSSTSPRSSTTTLCVLCIQKICTTPLWNSETLLQNSRTPLYVHLSFAGHLSVFFKHYNYVNQACQILLATFIDCYTDRWYLTLTFTNLGKDVAIDPGGFTSVAWPHTLILLR